MNKVMYGENRRRGGRNMLCRLLRSGRWFLCLALLCSAILPGYVNAAPYAASCTSSAGTVTLQLPPSVSFRPDAAPPDNKLLYTSPLYQVSYECTADKLDNFTGRHPALLRLSNLGPLTTILQKAGLELRVTVGGVEKEWSFTDKSSPDFVELPVDYKPKSGGGYTTGIQTLKLQAKLYAKNFTNQPAFFIIPSLSAFNLKPTEPLRGNTGVQINTPPVRIQYVPTCFVQSKLSTGQIDFGPVMTTDVGNSFSRTQSFRVTATANSSCGGYSTLIKGQSVTISGQPLTLYLDLPLKVSFMLNSGGRLSGNNIRLYKGKTTTENGLQLKITDDSDNEVKFGEITSPDVQSLPGNKLGEFSNGDFSVNKTYKVVLSATGDPLVTGRYRAQVTVKVEYY
ncbi:fimbrial protein [Salmonella enterica]|nr:fimbrial protein [Salmonella enterica]